MTKNIIQRLPNPGSDHVPTRFLHRLFMRPFPKQVAGDIRLGFVYNSQIVLGLLGKELVQHFLLVGRSGSGKTNVLRIMQIELARLGIPFMSFDLAKFGTRYIRHLIDGLMLLRWDKEFSFNLFVPPPGVSVKEWIMMVCDITSDVFGIHTASNLFLMRFIQQLFDQFKGHYPTMHDLNDALKARAKQRIPRNEVGYIHTIRNKIEPICFVLGDMIGVQKGVSIEELLKHPVCIELVGIKSSTMQIWIMSLIMAWITCYRENQPMGFGKLQHVFFFDEAAQVIGKGE